MIFIDTHAHLSDKAFETDREELIAGLLQNGLGAVFEVLCSAEDWDKTALFDKYPENFFFSLGIHPEYPDQLKEENFSRLRGLLAGKKNLFIGETGLDYWWDVSHKKEQSELLLRQLDLSSELSKPCVFHCRNGRDPAVDNAYADLLGFLKKDWKYRPAGKKGGGEAVPGNTRYKKRGIMHSFSGSWEDAVKTLDLGLYLGINGTFTYPRNGELRGIVARAGLENIVLETDCPYLPPQSMRGKRNAPSSVIEICGAVASHLGKTVGETAERVYLNSVSFIE